MHFFTGGILCISPDTHPKGVLPSKQLVHLASGESKLKAYGCEARWVFLISGSTEPSTSALTAVALLIPQVTLYRVLHPQWGAHTALGDGVTVAMARTREETACKEATGLRSLWREGMPGFCLFCTFHRVGPQCC